MRGVCNEKMGGNYRRPANRRYLGRRISPQSNHGHGIRINLSRISGAKHTYIF